MKKILLMGAIGLSVFSFAQNKFESPKDYYFKSKKTADSLNVVYSTTEQIENIEIVTDFKDRMLFDNNYKDPEKRLDIIKEFKVYLPKKIDYFKLCTSEEKILDFYNLETVKQYTKAYIIVRNSIREYLKNSISENETKIIDGLRKANYPIEKFNKLSDMEKDEVLEKIDSGYVYP